MLFNIRLDPKPFWNATYAYKVLEKKNISAQEKTMFFYDDRGTIKYLGTVYDIKKYSRACAFIANKI